MRAATGLPLREITAFLRISRSSYEYHRARLGRDRDADIRASVVGEFGASDERYGYRRVWAALRARGVRASEKRVRRVMREEGLEARRPRRRRYSSYAGEEGRAVAPNLLLADASRDRHDFSAPAPGEALVTDITEFRLPCGEKAYLSAVVDCFDGRPAGWSIGPSPTARLANSSLEAACDGLAPGERPVVHSDRGGHYRWPGWVEVCRRNRLVRSMSRKGMSCDNARMEGFFGTLKSEFYIGTDWSGTAPEEFIAELDAYMRWYRDGRLKAFREGGRTVYDTIAGRRRRLGYAA